jgi:hypothetical protein
MIARTSGASVALALGPSGKAMVLVVQGDQVRSTRYSPASGWSAPATIQTLSGSDEHAGIGVDAAGNYIAVWSRIGSTGSLAYASRDTQAQGWSSPATIRPDRDVERRRRGGDLVSRAFTGLAVALGRPRVRRSRLYVAHLPGVDSSSWRSWPAPGGRSDFSS